MIPDRILLPYQAKWIEDTTKLKVCVKSRRIGLTWAEALDSVLLASRDKDEGGYDVNYISTKQELSREFIDTCREWIKAWCPGDITGFEQVRITEDDAMLAMVITFKSGHKIRALTSNPKNLRGLQGRVIIDEGAFAENLPEIMKAAVACTLWKGDIRLISTHNGIENPFNIIVEDIKKGAYKEGTASLHEITIDDAIAQGLAARVAQVQGVDISTPELYEKFKDDWLEELLSIYGDGASEELYCKPKSGLDSYFKLETLMQVSKPTLWADWAKTLELRHPTPFIETFYQPSTFYNLSPEDQLNQTKFWFEGVRQRVKEILFVNYTAYMGVDFGRVKDLTVITVLINPLLDKPAYYLTLELRTIPYHCQTWIIKELINSLKAVNGIALDAGGNGGNVAEEIHLAFRNTHTVVDRIMFSAPILKETFQNYKNGLEDQKFLIPQDRFILADHLGIELKNGIPKATQITSRDSSHIKRHCDSVYAYVLAWHVYGESTLRKAKPFATPSPNFAMGVNYSMGIRR